MKTTELYSLLDNYFELDTMPPDFGAFPKNRYVTESFYRKYMGLMLDNTGEIGQVYTVTFPDKTVLDKILAGNERNILVFSHHGIGWDPTNRNNPVRPIEESYYRRLKENKISLYVVHGPLDKNGKTSTSVSFANALGLDITGEFCEYNGMKVGIIARAGYSTVRELKACVEKVVGHEAALWGYGDEHIRDGVICIGAGGGSYPFVIDQVAKVGANTYITGSAVPAEMDIIREFHENARKKGINVIAATHYSSEKFALIAMVDRFQGWGLPCRFIEGRYYLEDYGNY